MGLPFRSRRGRVACGAADRRTGSRNQANTHGDLYGNVRKNNHIAWKNIEVWDLAPGTGAPVTGAAVFANLGQQPMNVKIRFEALDANGAPALLTNGMLKITPVGAMKQFLRAEAARGKGIRDLGDGMFAVTANNAVLEGITLPPKQFGRVEIAFIPNTGTPALTGCAFRVTQIEQAPDGDRTIGGQTMVFGKVKGFNTSSGKGAGGLRDIRHWPWWRWLLIALIVLILLLLLFRRR